MSDGSHATFNVTSVTCTKVNMLSVTCAPGVSRRWWCHADLLRDLKRRTSKDLDSGSSPGITRIKTSTRSSGNIYRHTSSFKLAALLRLVINKKKTKKQQISADVIKPGDPAGSDLTPMLIGPWWLTAEQQHTETCWDSERSAGDRTTSVDPDVEPAAVICPWPDGEGSVCPTCLQICDRRGI